MIYLLVFSYIFYSLNITGFKIKNFVLATSCLKDEPIDLAFWVPYTAAVVTFIFAPNVGRWLLFGIFTFFHVVCFYSTYKYWIWKNNKKANDYNRHFSHTHHIIKPRENVLTPDTFHLIIFSLMLINLIAIIIYLII